MPHEPWHQGLVGFEGFQPQDTPVGDVGEEIQKVRRGERADIPTAIGGSFDRVYDTAIEQPAWAEDPIDVVGPSVGEVTDAVGITRDLDPTKGDESGFLRGQSGVKVAVALLIVGAVLWLLRPLFEIGASAAEVAAGE